MDVISKRDISNISEIIQDSNNDRELFYYKENQNKYCKVSDVSYRDFDGKKFPILIADDSKKTYCFIYGKYKAGSNDPNYNNGNQSRYFYIDFTELNIYNAKRVSLNSQ